MKLPQSSIARMIVFVVIVAINFAIARALFAFNPEMLIGIALMGLLLQFGLFRLVVGPRRGRLFWIGFILCGLTVMVSLVWAMFFPEVLGIRGGALIRTPGSPLHTIWYGYANFVSERIIAPVLYDPRINPGPNRDSVVGGASIVAIRAVVWFLPQLSIAMVGGLLTGLLSMRPGKRPEGYPHVSSPIYS